MHTTLTIHSTNSHICYQIQQIFNKMPHSHKKRPYYRSSVGKLEANYAGIEPYTIVLDVIKQGDNSI